MACPICKEKKKYFSVKVKDYEYDIRHVATYVQCKSCESIYRTKPKIIRNQDRSNRQIGQKYIYLTFLTYLTYFLILLLMGNQNDRFLSSKAAHTVRARKIPVLKLAPTVWLAFEFRNESKPDGSDNGLMGNSRKLLSSNGDRVL